MNISLCLISLFGQCFNSSKLHHGFLGVTAGKHCLLWAFLWLWRWLLTWFLALNSSSQVAFCTVARVLKAGLISGLFYDHLLTTTEAFRMKTKVLREAQKILLSHWSQYSKLPPLISRKCTYVLHPDKHQGCFVHPSSLVTNGIKSGKSRNITASRQQGGVRGELASTGFLLTGRGQGSCFSAPVTCCHVWMWAQYCQIFRFFFFKRSQKSGILWEIFQFFNLGN